MESEQVLEVLDIILSLIQLKTQSRFFISDSCITPKSYFIHLLPSLLSTGILWKCHLVGVSPLFQPVFSLPNLPPENLISLPLMPSFFQILIYNVEEDKAKHATWYIPPMWQRAVNSTLEVWFYWTTCHSGQVCHSVHISSSSLVRISCMTDKWS